MTKRECREACNARRVLINSVSTAASSNARARSARVGASLQAAKAKRQAGAIRHWPRKCETPSASALCFGGDGGTARVPQSQQLGGFVESFPDGVVQGVSQHRVTPGRRDVDQHRVPTGYEKRKKRVVDGRFQLRRQQMPF
jgi:hypothetical protein